MVTTGVVTTDHVNDPGREHARQFDDAERDEIEALRGRFERDAPQAFTDDDRSRFNRITGALGVPRFPATREELLDVARAGGAPDSVMVVLRSLPEASTYASYDELLLALGVGTAGRIDVPGAPARDPEGGATSLPDRA
jgi:Protein of unknown function (DUF2795)